MLIPGRFKYLGRGRSYEALEHPEVRGKKRVRRIVDSLLEEICSEDTVVRARRIFETPREIFRLEIRNASLRYQRTTLLDRETLEAVQAEAQGRLKIGL